MEPPVNTDGPEFGSRIEDWEACARRSFRVWRPPKDHLSPENDRSQACRRVSLQAAGRALAPIYQWLNTLGVERQTQSPVEGIAMQVA